jgi:hypothetical protein
VLEHISEEALQKYKERSLPPAEVLQVCDHLESCPQCREKLTDLHQLDSLFNSFLSELQTTTDQLTPHLSPEEVIAYVHSELDDVDRETADSHLMYCSACNADIQDLRLFKASLHRPPLEVEQPEKKLDVWHKALLFWRQSAWGLAIQATAFAALVFFLITTLSLKGQVSDLHGKLGELRLANDTLQQQLEALPEPPTQVAQLEPDKGLVLDHSGDTESLIDNGRQVAVKQGALTGLESLPTEYSQLVTDALLRQRVIKRPLPEELIPQKEETLMAPEVKKNFFPLVYPKNKIIDSERPTLRWGALAGATSYSVTVYDANANLVARSPQLSTTSWELPEALKRGAIYSWEVMAIREKKEIFAPAPPVPPARFKVLEQSRFAALNRARQAHNSHLLMGTLYAQAGLIDDAEREFRALLTANPQSQLAKKLLSSLQALKTKKR